MKAFHFRMEHLLGLRQQEEELQKLKLGQATRRCEEIQQNIDMVRTEQVRSAGSVSLDAFLARQAWLLRLAKERKDLEHQSVQAQEVKELVLKDYVHTRQKAEVLRKLKDRHLGEYRKEVLREQEALQDDLVQARLIIRHEHEKMTAQKEEIPWHK